MFRKIFKSVKDKLFSRAQQKPAPVQSKVESQPNIPPTKEKIVRVHVSRKDRRTRKHGKIGNGSKGTCYWNGKPDKEYRRLGS